MADYLGEISMRSGDQLPGLSVAFETDTGVPVDITGASRVDFLLTNEDGQDPRVVASDPPQSPLVLSASVVDAVHGIVSYDWGTADALRPGVVELVAVAYLPTGAISAPTDRTARILVRPDVPTDAFIDPERSPA